MRACATVLSIGLLLGGWAQGVVCADPTGLREIKHEIQTIRADEERERVRHERLIQQLEKKIDRLEVLGRGGQVRQRERRSTRQIYEFFSRSATICMDEIS